MSIVKDDVTKAVGNLQLCGGQDAGCEAVMHLMLDIFGTSKTEEVVLVGAENAFSSINRQVFSHNIKHICPPIVTFVRNCYNVPARLFALGGKELLSHEGTTQGDPTAMAIYRIALTPLLNTPSHLLSRKRPKNGSFC